jgi:DNA-binding LacI/PurR family transcriptional regulator
VARARIRLIDIAERCGVSKAAVARALGRPAERSELRPETYERIRRAARAMGWRAGGGAAATPRVALAFGGGAPSLFSITGHLVAIFVAALADLGRDTLLIRGQEDSRWIDRLLEHEVESVAVLWPEPEGVVTIAERAAIPVVAIEACHELPVPRVLFDDVGNGRRLTQHLLRLGHRRIAFLEPSQSGHPSRERRTAGWRETLRAAGGTGPLLAWGGAQDAAALASLLRGPQAPTAIVCHDDGEAFAVLQLAASLGITVPERLSVIGCNASRYASWPPLTSMYLHPELAAKAAAGLLVDLASGRASAPRKPVLIAGEIEPGASTAPPPAAPRKRRRSARRG